MYSCTKFQLLWRPLYFGTKFEHKRLYDGVLGQTQAENNLFQLSKKYYNMAGFRVSHVASGWFQIISGGFRLFVV